MLPEENDKMTTKVTLVRNPYPVPDISREGNWILDGPYLGPSVSTCDKTWQAKLQPHERLFAHHTLTSIRKDHRLFRPQVNFLQYICKRKATFLITV